VHDLERMFSADGPLARRVSAFTLRACQLEMAKSVASAIEDRAVLVAEAGTGTGKTFAYLVPAIESGGKVIVSTGTKTLQDQLFERDIPLVRAALAAPVTVALLKGRGNYVCHHHLERARAETRFGGSGDERHLAAIERFARMSRSGDRAECPEVPETSAVWQRVTSTRENCLGAGCEHLDRCFVMKARRAALEADLVVVNHHLFFADLMLRDEGLGELLPNCNTVIFDEAHQIAQTATQFFGESVTTTQLSMLARDVVLEGAAAAKDSRALPERARELDAAARDLRLVFSEAGGRIPARALAAHRPFQDALDTVLQRLSALAAELEVHGARSEGLQRCHARVGVLSGQLERWRSGGDDDERVRWVELFASALHLHATPLTIAEIFGREVLAHARSWVFTSATLSVAGAFEHYCRELGLAEPRTQRWESPFDYPRQSLLYVPADLPEPNTPGHTRAVVAAALPLIEASGGRAFLLFTSLKAMREAHALLTGAFDASGCGLPLLLQGESSRSELLARFRRAGNAVLVASHSFWEGVDVKGEALSLVVIDKLPFAAPDDPVLAARIERLSRNGRNAFVEYQLPQAVITLKQGAGRLIRDERDRGVLMICDSRLYGRSYGRRILESLPPMRRTRSLDEARSFFAGAASLA
jgi:ATP-dependent DNA helicase DinG